MVPPGSRSCPGCGADEETGWGTGSVAEGGGTHLEDDAYDDFVREELDDEPIETSGPSRFGFLLVVLGVLVVATILALLTTAKPK